MTADAVPMGWRIHDVLVGILGGGGVGAVAGIFLAARVVDSSWPIWAGLVVGAVLGIAAMNQTRKGDQGFWTVTTIALWVMAIAAIVFIATLARAILNFE